jgi:hemerythrin superfamily protein
MDAISLLRADHKTVEQLFKRFEKAGDRAYAEKRQIVDRIIEELAVHAAIEEQVFYPVVRQTVPDTEDIALESLEEHHIVKWVLSELVDLDPQHERFDAKVTVLMENVRHHIEEEEDEFFPTVRAQLSRTALADVGQALADARRTAPTRPHPRLPDEPPGNAVVGALAGVVDRVGGNVTELAQGGVNAVQELIARIIGSSKPTASRSSAGTGRGSAKPTRRSTSTERAKQTPRRAKSAAATPAKRAESGAKSKTAKKSAQATKKTTKRASTTSGRSAKPPAKKAVAAGKRAGTKARTRATAAA